MLQLACLGGSVRIHEALGLRLWLNATYVVIHNKNDLSAA